MNAALKFAEKTQFASTLLEATTVNASPTMQEIRFQSALRPDQDSATTQTIANVAETLNVHQATSVRQENAEIFAIKSIVAHELLAMPENVNVLQATRAILAI